MKYDAVIIGGGIIGLATAYKLKLAKPLLNIAVLEKESGLAGHQSGHNSGVIHSGIYYKPGSLKAINCRKGRLELIEFCTQHNIPFVQDGKIVVATTHDEAERLKGIYTRGLENGLEGIKLIGPQEIKEREPHIRGVAAIFVPQTGMVDFKQVALKYAELFKGLGGEIFLNEKVIAINKKSDSSETLTPGAAYRADVVINCAGLYCDKIAAMGGAKLNVRIIPFRGEYYKFKPEKAGLIRGLVYPVPDPAFPFLGAHFIRHMGGEVSIGPNAVFAFKREGYGFWDFNFKDFFNSIFWRGFQKLAIKNFRTGSREMYRSLNKAAFVKNMQKLLPEIKEEDLERGGSGVRAQACFYNGQLADDFVILESQNQIDVLNAPSPAATSSLAIGGHIAEMALKRFNP